MPENLIHVKKSIYRRCPDYVILVSIEALTGSQYML